MPEQVAARPRLMIVDDDANVATTLQAVLEQEGFQVWSANSAKEADALITSQEFDVALVDLRLGEDSGIDVLQSLRSHQADCVPVMLTGYASLESAVDAIRHGVFDYLVKPCELDELRKTLKAAIQKGEMTRALRARQKRLASGQRTDLTQELQRSLGSVKTEGVILRDPTGRVRFANEAAAALLGFKSESELIGSELQSALANADVIDADGKPVASDRLPWHRALAGLQQPSSVMRLRDRASRRERTALIRSMPVFREDGGVDFEITTITDITDQSRAGDALRLLAETGELLGRSQSVDKILAGIADLAVPVLADWCAIVLLGTDGDKPRFGVRHRDPARTRDLEGFISARLGGQAQEGSAALRVLNPAQPEIHQEVSSSIVEALSRSPAERSTLESIGLKSLMVLPLAAHGASFGTMVLATGTSGRVFDSHDLSLAHEMARRCALAAENARLLQREQAARRKAEASQRLRSAQYAVSQAILDAGSAKEAMPKVLSSIGESLRTGPVRLWTEVADGTYTCSETWSGERRDQPVDGIRKNGVASDIASGLPVERRKFPAEIKRGSGAAVVEMEPGPTLLIPIVTRRGATSIIELRLPTDIEPDQEFLESITTIGAKIGLFIDRKEFEALVRDLSTPVLPVDERLLLVPLIGTLDAQRATQLIDRVLDAVRANRARAVVVDLTGVAPIDAFVAGQLLKMVSAARLLGAYVIVSGISPDVCETLVRIQMDTRRLRTASDLLSGLEEARRLLALDAGGGTQPAGARPLAN